MFSQNILYIFIKNEANIFWKYFNIHDKSMFYFWFSSYYTIFKINKGSIT